MALHFPMSFAQDSVITYKCTACNRPKHYKHEHLPVVRFDWINGVGGFDVCPSCIKKAATELGFRDPEPAILEAAAERDSIEVELHELQLKYDALVAALPKVTDVGDLVAGVDVPDHHDSADAVLEEDL